MTELATIRDPNNPTEMLAYYDTRGIDEAQLLKIFGCSAEDLTNERNSDAYKEYLGREANELTEQATALDDAWNSVEQIALGSLIDAVEHTADPRMLLSAAVQANKAGRRGSSVNPNNGNTDIVVPQNGSGETRVVRLRAKFVDVLQEPDGTKKLMERQVEVTTSGKGDLNEQLSPQRVKGILKNDIGVDTEQMHVKHHQGPDVIDGSYVDFDNIGEI